MLVCSMVRRTFWEIIACGALVFALLIYTAHGIIASRTAVRDNLRKEDVTNMKHALEAYFNAHEFYMTPPEEKPACTHSNEEGSWFFSSNSALLTEQYVDALPHDVREHKGYAYTYCAIDVNEKGAQGYTLQAKLEIDQKDACLFDEDESRKFEYQISHKDRDTIYTVFGGSAPTCYKPEETLPT